MGYGLVVVGCCDLIVWVRFCWTNGGLGEDLGLVVVGCDLVVVGCCDLIVWVRFCWINDGLGEDLGLVVVGCDWC